MSMRVEILWPNFLTKHDVIIHVDELGGESRNVMKVALYGRGRKGRQVTQVLEYLLNIKTHIHSLLANIRSLILLPCN